MQNDLASHISDIAKELNVPSESIGNLSDFGSFLIFNVNGAEYTVDLTRTGKCKKNSIRLAA